MVLNSICNKYNVSLGNKKKNVCFLNVQKNTHLNQFLIKNNLIKNNLVKNKIISKFLFNYNKPKFKNIKILNHASKYKYK